VDYTKKHIRPNYLISLIFIVIYSHGLTKYQAENLFHCHFVCHKYHMEFSGTELVSLLWVIGNKSCGPRQVQIIITCNIPLV